MMLGTVASARRTVAAPPPPEWLPAGATTFLDFVAGNYYANGAERTLTACLGGALDEGEISASGMYIDGTNSNRPTPIGPFLSDLLAGLIAGMTVVFEVTTASSLGGFLLYLGSHPSYHDAWAWNVVSVDGAVWDEGPLDISVSISGAGTHKIAVTYNRAVGGANHEYAWSHDGNTASTQTVAYAAYWMTYAQLGWTGLSGDGLQLFQTYIRTITLYPAKTPGELPALTDLPTA